MSKKAITEPTVRVLKNGTCPNLSGKSTLSYRIGVDEAGLVMLQLVGNSNPGYFNNEWVPYSTVRELLAKQDQGKAITSFDDAAVPGQEHQFAFLPVRRFEAGGAGEVVRVEEALL